MKTTTTTATYEEATEEDEAWREFSEWLVFSHGVT